MLSGTCREVSWCRLFDQGTDSPRCCGSPEKCLQGLCRDCHFRGRGYAILVLELAETSARKCVPHLSSREHGRRNKGIQQSIRQWTHDASALRSQPQGLNGVIGRQALYGADHSVIAMPKGAFWLSSIFTAERLIRMLRILLRNSCE